MNTIIDRKRIHYFCTGEDYEKIIKLNPDCETLTMDEFDKYCEDAIYGYKWLHDDIKHYTSECCNYKAELILKYVLIDAEYVFSLAIIKWVAEQFGESMIDKLIDYGKTKKHTIVGFEYLLNYKAQNITINKVTEEFLDKAKNTDKYELYIWGVAFSRYDVDFSEYLLNLSSRAGFMHDYSSGFIDNSQYYDLVKKYAHLSEQYEELITKHNKTLSHLQQLQSLPDDEIYEAAKKEFYEFEEFYNS